MNFLYPVETIALQLKYRLDNFYLEIGAHHLIPAATRPKCMLLAKAMVLQQLRSWLPWWEIETREKKLTRAFGPFPKEFIERGHRAGAMARLCPNDEYLHPQFKAMFVDAVGDPIECLINQIFGKYFGDQPSWDVFEIKEFGYNLILERKGDYRIWDWSNSRGVNCHPWGSCH
ncbi:hypothetical protein [Streptomyces sp. CHB9.2]|uniref:hypothetical protein n=1 Tax=Streptomyces sp. CHB9.2 TaxID=2841670 RepID=UPI00209573E8|nr:hypothetical protein [Streptomyces sp. CHB9.2]MCO6704902.1 hypothetical protein [Streptomyces sp. CHB9.2]